MDDRLERRQGSDPSVKADLQSIFDRIDYSPWSPERRAAAAAVIRAPAMSGSFKQSLRGLRSHASRMAGVAMALAVALALGSAAMVIWHRAPSAEPVAGILMKTPAIAIEPRQPVHVQAPERSVPLESTSVASPAAPVPKAPRLAAQHKAKPAAGPAKTRCEGLTEEKRAGCFHPMVLAADTELRQAYAEAEAAGTPRSALAAVRDRWVDVDRQFADDPKYLIANLHLLTNGLRESSRSARRER